MDELQASLLEECCLEGVRGLPVTRLFGLVSARTGARIDEDLEVLLWRRLRAMEELELYSGVEGGGGPGAPAGELMDRGVAGAAEWGGLQHRAKIWIVAREPLRHAVLGLHSTAGLAEKSMQMLEELGRSRDKGIQQRELASILGIDAKSVFYFLKPLKHAGLVSVKSISVTGESSSTTRTNIIKLAKYDPAGTGQEDEGSLEEQYAMMIKKAVDLLKASKDGVLSEGVLKKLTTNSRKGARKHHIWEKIRKTLLAEKKIERILVQPETGQHLTAKKPVPAIRLLVHHGGLEAGKEDSNHVKEVPIAQQLYRLIEGAGTRGCTTTDFREQMRMDSKLATIMAQDLVFNFGVKTKADFKGKAMQYRYYTPENFDKIIQMEEGMKAEPLAVSVSVVEDAAQMFAPEVPEGMGVKAAVQEAAAGGRAPLITSEWIRNHPYWISKVKAKKAEKEAKNPGKQGSEGRSVITARFLTRANQIVAKLREDKAMQSANVRNILREQEEMAARKDDVVATTVDYKTIERLLNDLVGLGLIQKKAFNFAKQTILSSSDPKRMTEFVFDVSVDLDDASAVADLVEMAMQVGKVNMFGKQFKEVVMDISKPVLSVEAFQDLTVGGVGGQPQEYFLSDRFQSNRIDKTSKVIMNLAINGLLSTVMARACALHRFVIDEYMEIGEGAAASRSGGFLLHQILYDLPFANFLQIVGTPQTVEDLPQLLEMHGGTRMRDLDEGTRERFVANQKGVDTRLRKSIHVLHLLGLVTMEIICSAAPHHQRGDHLRRIAAPRSVGDHLRRIAAPRSVGDHLRRIAAPRSVGDHLRGDAPRARATLRTRPHAHPERPARR